MGGFSNLVIIANFGKFKKIRGILQPMAGSRPCLRNIGGDNGTMKKTCAMRKIGGDNGTMKKTCAMRKITVGYLSWKYLK